MAPRDGAPALVKFRWLPAKVRRFLIDGYEFMKFRPGWQTRASWYRGLPVMALCFLALEILPRDEES